ncbi:hypothetical protein [Sphingomonas sp. LaA6.9]|uniref:hypothetical protein n=1 Tax=Sphingomonas sp. LaA6.9 TaxID=2919914 RepID=UPI001F4F4364|nr:hypothetical protein [Sphingomonas sp. LaA6.9]MCJ8157396.1 hypothetical protein [Sphingomonas sp. LaA6.9]
MTNVDGVWDWSAKTPLGEQRVQLTVKREGDTFTGGMEGAFGSVPVTDGTISGDTLTYSAAVTKPMPITLQCELTVSGDTLSGTVSAAGVGSFPASGQRAA